MLHFHFLVWAAEAKHEANFTGVTYVDLQVNSADEALKRAKEVCKGLNKKVFWIQNITECHDGYEK